MNVDSLLLDLSSRGVKISVEGEQLRLRAPKGVLTPDLQELLSEHKAEILRLLSGDGVAATLERVSRDQPLQLSFMQERIWFLAQMYPRAVAYNLPNAYRLRGRLDPQALVASLEALVERHEVLRTTFSSVDGMAVQRVAPELPLELEHLDLSSEPYPQKHADRLAREDANHAFDLEHGPLFKCRLLRLGSDEHLLLWTIHHIVADGWSSVIYLRELKALYEAYASGKEAALADLPFQYADFAAWERRVQHGERLEPQLAYWREKLTAPLPVLELPTDHPRPAVVQYRGDYRAFKVRGSLTRGLKRVAAAHGGTLFMTLLAAYKVLLQRYSQQDDICVGSPIARRSQPEFESIFGCFINSLPLRTDLSEDPPFHELLRRVSDTCSGAFRHQDVPFEQILEATEAPRDTSHTPLFQVMFILHVQDTRKITAIGDVELTPVEYHTKGSKFDLTLELKETAEGLEGFFEYSTDLYDASTIERMAEHFQVLLAGIVANPQSRLSELPLLTVAERTQQLSEWNATVRDFPLVEGVQQLFEAQARQTPDAVAVSCSGTHLSYQSLDQRANRIARRLRALGLADAARVGLCLERSVDMLAALLGVLKAGAAYVPLDPSFPADRLQFMVDDAGIGLLLTQASLRDLLPADRGATLYLDGDAAAIDGESADPLTPSTDPERLAYVIYTSGSTGRPKGVQIPHRALTNLLCSMAETPGIGSDDTLLAVTTLSFDIAGLELYLPLLVGARVVIASREEAADGTRLAALLADCGASVMQATPSTWRLLLESGWRGRAGLKALSGGEALPRDLAEQLLGAGLELWNMYGPTETTIWSAVEPVVSGEAAVPIGRPIANTSLYVLGEGMSLLPRGALGELYIGGYGLARGYLNRRELTAERFVANPFLQGERLYRTGDRARYLPDGRLEVLGRTDYQVKVRGYRIELGEIEAVLLRHPRIQDAVVTVREDVAGDKRIVGYVIDADGESAPVAELRAHLKQSLPDYMLPSAFVRMQSFPLTLNNKVDRRALPAPDGSAVPAVIYEAPRDELDGQLAAIWARVLGVERVGITDDFFELGGHSLLAVRLVADMEREAGLKLPLAFVFQGRNIAAIRRLATGEGSSGETGPCIALRASGHAPPFFAGGSHPAYQTVVDHLDADQPVYRMDVYALQSRRMEEGLKPLRSVAAIAAEFVRGIQRIQPRGPYHLGGGCEGGIVAFEVARQLQALGEDVASLVIWGVEAPKLFRRAGAVDSLKLLAWEVLNRIRNRSPSELRMRDLALLARHQYLEYLIFSAVSRHRPDSPFRGRITLARHYIPGFPGIEEDCMGWSELATEGVEVHTLPGRHEDYLLLHAREFAGFLAAQLAPTLAAKTRAAPYRDREQSKSVVGGVTT